MRSVLQHLLGLLAVPSPSSMIAAAQPSCSPFPSTIIDFSSTFQQPNPPLISAEFKSSWRQHKWSLQTPFSPEYLQLLTDTRNVNISHITSGFLYNSPTLKKVRVDEAYDTTIASSLFNYNNISSDGLVSNIMYSFSPSIASKPTFFSDFVNPNFPLFAEDMLVSNEAVYTGLIERANSGIVASVNSSA